MISLEEIGQKLWVDRDASPISKEAITTLADGFIKFAIESEVCMVGVDGSMATGEWTVLLEAYCTRVKWAISTELLFPKEERFGTAFRYEAKQVDEVLKA